MKIIYITAGAGDMYCGACARDVNLVNGLAKAGVDVLLVPLYTPLRTEREHAGNTAPIFYGGINVYLQQVSAAFQHTPRMVAQLLDNPTLLRWVSKFAIHTKPKDLGKMTVSVLRGENGEQRKELVKLVDFIEKESPQVVNLTNSMLSGIAESIKKSLKIPVVCTLQGEDSFVEAIPEPYNSEARELLQKNACHIDAFIAPSPNYAKLMTEFLQVPAAKIYTIASGVDLDAYPYAPERPGESVIGYLSRISPEKGLDTLVEAFALLRENMDGRVSLKVAGKIMDEEFWRDVQKRIKALSLQDLFHYEGELGFTDKINFLHNVSIFSVPSRFFESRAMAMLEAMAAGTPVILPDSGSFPELLTMTKGGVLFAAEQPRDLAKQMARVLEDQRLWQELSSAGRVGIENHFSQCQMVEKSLELYNCLCKGGKQ